MRKFFSDFKKFINKGNVVDLAVAVIIGTAFNKIVSSLVADIITPLISLALGQVNFTELNAVLRTEPLLTLNYGNFIQLVIDFLIISFTVFVMVKIFAKVKSTMDFNANMIINVQEKLDKDEELNKFEKKWLKKYTKHNPSNAPKKKIPEPVVETPKEPTTNELLMEILLELRKDNKSDKSEQ